MDDEDSLVPAISRRGALLSVLGGITALVSCTTPPSAKEAEDRLGEQLRQDLTRLGARSYSEEGVAVFLVCENRVESGKVSGNRSATRNVPLAATFRRHAEILPSISQNASEEDVDKLIEVLAERDFGVLRPADKRP